MEKKKRQFIDENTIFLLLPSILGIGVSLFFLVGLTFAWFNTSIETTGQNLIAANFDVDMIIKNTDGAIINNTEKTYTLEPGNYEITIKRSGTSTESLGYAELKIGENIYYTNFLNKSEDLIFQIYTDSSLKIEIKPIWSSYGVENKNLITNDTKIENITESPVEETNPNKTVEETTKPEPTE